MKVVNVAFFSEQGLEVVSGLNFLLMCEEDSMGIGEEGVWFDDRLWNLIGVRGLSGIVFEEILGRLFDKVLGILLWHSSKILLD